MRVAQLPCDKRHQGLLGSSCLHLLLVPGRLLLGALLSSLNLALPTFPDWVPTPTWHLSLLPIHPQLSLLRPWAMLSTLPSHWPSKLPPSLCPDDLSKAFFLFPNRGSASERWACSAFSPTMAGSP